MLLYVSMAAWAACSVLKRIVPMPCTQADDALRYEKVGRSCSQQLHNTLQ